MNWGSHMRVWSQKMTAWLKGFRGWLAGQPLVVAVMKPQQLRGRGLEQTLVQVFTPVLAFALVVGGGIGAAFTAPQPAVLVEVELAAQNIEVAATNELEIFELEDFEPEEYHSVAQYAANVRQYKKAVTDLRPVTDWQRNRQAKILSSLEISEWVIVGSVDTDLCFQHSKTVECIESETLETLREGGKEFAEANPTGIGLCYDWFEEVCVSGDWFDSKERFTSVINTTREYVVTGKWSVETSELALEASPAYAPTASAVELQPGTLEWLDAQEDYNRLVAHPCYVDGGCSYEQYRALAKEMDQKREVLYPRDPACYVILDEGCVPESEVVPDGWREAEAKCRADTGLNCAGYPPAVEDVWTSPGTPAPVEEVWTEPPPPCESSGAPGTEC